MIPKTPKTVKDLQDAVKIVFESNFSRTPLRQRLEDISKETTELVRFTDLANLKEEAGDVLSSVIQLCNESGWNAADLVQSTLNKIQHRTFQYQGLGRKVSVALIGGSMNPITVGHIKLAQFVLNTSKIFDEAWITPCHRHMHGKDLAEDKHRLKMCEIAAKVDPRIKIFDYEIKHKLTGATYHFLKRLFDEDFAKHQYDFSYVIGLDNANTFDKWVNYEDLERMIRFVVVGRQGVQMDHRVRWYFKPPHVFLNPENNEIPDTASSQVRKALYDVHCNYHCVTSLNLIRKQLDPNVFEYIQKNGLYK